MSDSLYCLDAGSDQLRFVSVSGEKSYFGKNIVVMQNSRQYAYGDAAYELYERAPARMEMIFPVKDGVISDFRALQGMLFAVMKRFRIKARHSSFAVAVPSGLTDLEQRAFFELFYKDKDHPQDVFLCERALADAKGMNIDVMSNRGSLLINFGADTTEISLLASGGIVSSRLMKAGSRQIDAALVRFLRDNYHIAIGRKTAVRLKKELGSCMSPKAEKRTVTGKDLISGLPVRIEISGEIIYQAMLPCLNQFCQEIRLAIEEIPPELSGDILETGLMITGGGSSLTGLSELLTELTGVNAKPASDPERTTILGLALLMQETDRKNLPAGMISMR